MAILALFPFSTGRHVEIGSSPPPLNCVIFVFCVGAMSSFLNQFSALGVHNFGLLGLAVSLVVTQYLFNEKLNKNESITDFRFLFLISIIQSFRFYTHHTNIFIIPCATIFSISLLFRFSIKERLIAIAFYCVAGLICALPVFVLIGIAAPVPGSDQDAVSRLVWVLGRDGFDPGGLIARLFGWWNSLVAYMSPAGVAIGLLGCIAMAWKFGATLPLTFVSTHFLMGAIFPGFNQFNRTGAYAVLVLYLGIGWFVSHVFHAWLNRDKSGQNVFVHIAALTTVCGMLSHALIEWPKLNSPQSVTDWRQLLLQKGTGQALVTNLERLVPEGSLFFVWNYDVSHRVRSLSTRFRLDMRYLRPLESFDREMSRGHLIDFIAQRGITVATNKPIYFLLEQEADQRRLETIRRIFGPGGLHLRDRVQISHVSHLIWPMRIGHKNGFDLYAVY